MPTDPKARLQQIFADWQQYPGRAPKGTGLTGIMPGDSKGYSDMLNERIEGMNLQNELTGQPDVQVNEGRTQGMKPSLGDDPNWWLSNPEMFNSGNPGAQSLQNAIPPSLRALHKVGA
jgi:hypothetical protein